MTAPSIALLGGDALISNIVLRNFPLLCYCTVFELFDDARVRQLRSADTRTLVVSRTRSSFGDRTFAAAGPQVCNSLPPNVRLCGLSYGQFRRLLKTSDSEATAQCILRRIEIFLLTYFTYLLLGTINRFSKKCSVYSQLMRVTDRQTDRRKRDLNSGAFATQRSL